MGAWSFDLHASRALFFKILIVGIAAGSGAATPSYAQTSTLLPPSRDEIADEDYLSWTLKKFPSQPYMDERYWNFPSYTPAFFRDSMFQTVTRTYYLPRDNFDGSKSEAWTLGGWVAFRSGLIYDLFGIHAAYYTSQKLFGPLDDDGTKLLAPGQEPLSVLGQLYGRMQVGDQEFRGGRQLVDTPLINAQDNRMVPNTFEGTTVVTLPDKDRRYDYTVGYLWSVKQRDSNDFIPMSNALTGDDTMDRGVTFGMVRFRPVDGLSLTAMDYYADDLVNTGFVQSEYENKNAKGLSWSVGANVIAQSSAGSDLVGGTDFDTFQASAKAQLNYVGWTLFVAGSITGDDSKIYSPFGTKPNYTDMQEVSFDNAGEKAIGASVAYDFGYSFNLPGFSVGTWYTLGSDSIDTSTDTEIPRRSELDVWMQYRPSTGQWKGLRLKAQYADVWQEDNARDSQPELRLIADYTILFRPPLN
jgi:hypothetical protein